MTKRTIEKKPFLGIKSTLGYLGPGGLADDARYSPRCVGGASGHIDRVILTEDHMYRNNEVAMYYRSAAYDPEGFLGELKIT